jgi:hypothetical protein
MISMLSSISVACYRPKPGCEEALLAEVRDHLPPLRAQGLVTERAPIVMRTQDGTVIEVFEWVSQEAIAGAHSNPVVLEVWKRFPGFPVHLLAPAHFMRLSLKKAAHAVVSSAADRKSGFEAVCSYAVPANIPEFQKMFAHFEPV